MKKALILLVIIIILAVGGYYALQPSGAVAPAPAAPTQTQPAPTSGSASATDQKPPANVGAAGVYDPTAPTGSPAQCAACGQYSGSQKAQCLAALHC